MGDGTFFAGMHPSLPGIGMEILTLPMREGILYLPCPSGIGIEILTLSVRVSIGMFSAHIKEYENTPRYF